VRITRYKSGMKFLPLLALAASCVLPVFAQTYRVQIFNVNDAFLNQAVFADWDATQSESPTAKRNRTPESFLPGSPVLTVTQGETAVYDGMKPAELTERFIGAKQQKAYEQVLKDDPQKVGLLVKISIKPVSADSNAVIVTADYAYKELWYFCKSDGKMRAYYQTTHWTSTQEVSVGIPTLIYSIRTVGKVIDRTPFWGDIPLFGRLFQKPGTSTSVHEYFVIVSLLPEKKS